MRLLLSGHLLLQNANFVFKIFVFHMNFVFKLLDLNFKLVLVAVVGANLAFKKSDALFQISG
jgi:hypothetical protein